MQLAPGNVLIVSGEEPVAEAIASALRRRGHSVVTANDADEALRQPIPEVLISDLELSEASGYTGFDLLADVRARGEYPHAILYTGRPTVDVFRRAMLVGGVQILLKPVQLDRLITAVEDMERLPAREEEPDDTLTGLDSDVTEFEESYLSRPDCVERAARDIGAFCMRAGIGPSGRCRVSTAVAEIVENARRHGYPDRIGTISMTAVIRDRDLSIIVQDLGRGFDSKGAGVELYLHPSTGGVARATALSEELQVESREGDGTRVRLSFCAFPVKFDEEDTVDLSELDYLAPNLARRVLTFLEEEDGKSPFRISPSLAVTIGRLLAGPDRSALQQSALWS